jgi:maltose phosphorylase
MKCVLLQGDIAVDYQSTPVLKEKYVATEIKVEAKQGEVVTLIKYATNLSSQNYQAEDMAGRAVELLAAISAKGFDTMLAEQAAAWAEKWKNNDIIIEGDAKAQQGIRFNIFQLNQTYTGEDDRLNIGPKGFTGEKYGGSTYWDTEAYCVPSTSPQPSRKLPVTCCCTATSN